MLHGNFTVVVSRFKSFATPWPKAAVCRLLSLHVLERPLFQVVDVRIGLSLSTHLQREEAVVRRTLAPTGRFSAHC